MSMSTTQIQDALSDTLGVYVNLSSVKRNADKRGMVRNIEVPARYVPTQESIKRGSAVAQVAYAVQPNGELVINITYRYTLRVLNKSSWKKVTTVI